MVRTVNVANCGKIPSGVSGDGHSVHENGVKTGRITFIKLLTTTYLSSNSSSQRSTAKQGTACSHPTRDPTQHKLTPHPASHLLHQENPPMLYPVCPKLQIPTAPPRRRKPQLKSLRVKGRHCGKEVPFPWSLCKGF